MVAKKQETRQPQTIVNRSKTTSRMGNQAVHPVRSKKDVKQGLLERLGIGRKATRVTPRYAPPGVVVRGTPVTSRATARNQVARPPVRRRYDMNVPTVPEASISLPSLPALHFSWRILSFGIVAGLLFSLYYLWTSPLFTVNQVEFTGLQRLRPYDLNAVLEIIDRPSFLIVPDTLEVLLMDQFPALTSASVNVEFPNRVLIDLVERTPLLIWVQAGRTDYIDSEGFAFPLDNTTTDVTQLGLPMVQAEGFQNEQAITPAEEPNTGLLTRILKFFKQEEELPKTLQPRQVMEPDMVKAILLLYDHAPQDSPLLYTEAHGLAWEDQAGWVVYFGDADHIDIKLRVYQTILRYLNKNEQIPELVSVEWVDAPYYRLEP